MDKEEIFFDIFRPKFIKKNHLFIFFLLTIISTFLCLFFVGNHSLIAHDELIYANRANLIIESRDWFTPFPEPHHKFVGSYWLTAFSLMVFGRNEFAARLPSYILSLGTLYVFYCLNKELINKKVAKLSALILSTSFLWFNFSHYCSPDILFIFLNILSVFYLSKINSFSNKKVNYKLIFFSACLFSFGFFVRSYMELLPLICFSPYIIHKLKFSNKNYFICFFLGFCVGFIPSLINLILAFIKYGDEGFLLPFSLLTQKVLVEESPLEGFLFYPRNIFLFNLPSIVFIFNGVNSILKLKNKDAKLLFLICPSVALVLLMLTASTYTHYLLFIIPWISTLIALGICESLSLNNTFNKIVLNIYTFLCLLFGFLLFLISLSSLFFDIQIIDLNSICNSIILIFGIFFIYFSFNIFMDWKIEKRFINIVKISFLQILLFSFLFGVGTIGNPNNEFKKFINTNITDDKKVYAIEGEIQSKRRRMLSFYLKDYINYDLNNYSNNDGVVHLFLLKNKLSKINETKNLKYEKIDSYKNLYFIKIYKN